MRNVLRVGYLIYPLIIVPVGVNLVVSCSESSFKAGGKRNSVIQDPLASDSPVNPITGPAATGQPPITPPVVVETVDYKACAVLPASGKSRYRQCPLQSAVVIVNDGSEPELTCCPISDATLFSTNPAEQNVKRPDHCLADEILTGMINVSPMLYCTKINTALYSLSSTVPSLYTSGSMPGDLGKIAASYNNSDTCVCPEGTLAIGYHSKTNNVCIEQCVKILKK